MHYLSTTVYAYLFCCENVVNQGLQNFGGLLYIGANYSYLMKIIIIKYIGYRMHKQPGWK